MHFMFFTVVENKQGFVFSYIYIGVCVCVLLSATFLLFSSQKEKRTAYLVIHLVTLAMDIIYHPCPMSLDTHRKDTLAQTEMILCL